MNRQETSRRWTLSTLSCIAITMFSTKTTAFAPAIHYRSSMSETFEHTQPIWSFRQSKGSSTMLSATSLMESQPKSFEERMREMVNIGRKKDVHSENNDSKLPKNVRIVKTLEEYKKVVGGERERIVVVRFFAPWCKACKAIAPLFYRMANNRPNVLFIEVPVTDSNANLHQGLQVPSLPYGHIYHPSGGLVEEDRIARKFFPQFAHKLQSYVNGSCELIDGECHSPYVQVQGAAEEREEARGQRTTAEF